MAKFVDRYGGYCTCTREKCSDECNTYRRYKPIPVTNADRLRAMTDEELAEWISGVEQFALTVDGAWSPESWLEWLKQEADNG